MAKINKTTKNLDVRVVFDPILGEAVRVLAEKQTRKPCQLVRHIVKEYFERIDREQPTTEGLNK